MEKLKQRWGIESNWAVVAIFIAFAINGSFAAWVAKPITAFLGLTPDSIFSLVVLAFTNFTYFSYLPSYPTYCWLVCWSV